MSHARVEELSDSDSDPPEDSLDDFVESDIISNVQPVQKQEQVQVQPPSQPAPAFNQSVPPDYKSYHCLYPVYFDASRSRAEGRRVGKDKAVENPLAREIVDAVQSLGLKVVFEPGKLHPKDWSNPGRVRIAPTRNIKNSMSPTYM